MVGTRAIQRTNQIDIYGNIAPAVATHPLPSSPPQAQFTAKWLYEGVKVYIKPNRIFCMPSYTGGAYVRSLAQRTAEANLANNKRKADISKKSREKIFTAVTWLAAAAKQKTLWHAKTAKHYTFKLNFITLTIPDTENEITSDEFKEKLLQPWLSYARKFFKLNNYVWKIERQNNGKLHVHIVSDTFIHHSDLRRSWNNQLHRNGWLEAFAAKHGHYAPPTENVTAVKRAKNLAGYAAKYLSKGEAHKEYINGRVWGCNYELSRSNTVQAFAPAQNEFSVLGSLLTPSIEDRPIYNGVKTNGFPKWVGTAFYVKVKDWLYTIDGDIRRAFDNFINYLRTGYEDPPCELVPIQYQ